MKTLKRTEQKGRTSTVTCVSLAGAVAQGTVIINQDELSRIEPFLPKIQTQESLTDDFIIDLIYRSTHARF